MKLTNLNTDCLLKIFSYCSESDLYNLCEANKYFCHVIENNIFYAQSIDLLLCGHRNGPTVEQRNHTQLSYRERKKVSHNWVKGIYKENPYYHHSQLFATKLCLEQDTLYVTYTNYLRKYWRNGPEGLQRRFGLEIATPTRSDISDFVKKRSTIFAGRICGTCFVRDGDGITEQSLHHPSEYLFCVDFVNDLYVTSTDKCCKLWRRAQEFGLTHFDMLMESDNGFKTFELSNDGQWLFGGLYTNTESKALRVMNVDSGKEAVLNSNSNSIYDLKLKDDHVLFTANFDTTLRMFDRRVNVDVSVWRDPFDSSFYCLEYDGLYAVLCGAKYHSRVNLYDIRVPDKYVQIYFPERTRQHNARSPVYSLACDSRYMFVATDHNLRVFDFKSNGCVERDYSHIYHYDRRVVN